MCRCQEKLKLKKLKKLRLALRRWSKRYAKFKAASRLIRKWEIPRPPEPQLSYGWNAASRCLARLRPAAAVRTGLIAVSLPLR
jgi:hypothetical protein